MNTARVSYISRDFALEDFDDAAWKNCDEICISRLWSGVEAEWQRHFTTKLVWTDTVFFIRFEGNQNEPLVLNANPNLGSKTNYLWERDVFEIFVAPGAENVFEYLEFEAAPTGEWLDLRIRISGDGSRQTDFEYDSGMRVATRIEQNKISLVMKIGWDAFGRKPAKGEVWRGNLFRCIGAGATRGYLAWQPTMTEQPNFHVPEKFGFFEFV